MICVLVQKDNEAEPMSKKELEIHNRKNKVWTLYRLGNTQLKIAEKLKVDVKTVSRDMSELKKESKEWLENFTQGDIQLTHKKNFELIEIIFGELFKIYHKTNDHKFRLKILNQVLFTVKTQTEMLDYKKILKIREVVIHENDFKTHYGRTPHHIDPFVALLTKNRQNS